MKNTLSITIFLFLSLVNFAQKDSLENTKTTKFGVSLNQSITRYGLPTSVLLTIHYKKHQFDIGPQFRLGVPIDERRKNIGLELNYRYYVNSDLNRFSSFILFNADYFYQYYKNSRHGVYYSIDPALNNQEAVSSQTYNLVAFNVGYGVRCKLFKEFYIGSNVGIGYLLSFEKFRIDLINVDYNTSKKRREDYLGFLGSVYIGYKF